MKKEEFEKMVQEENEKGRKAIGLTISNDEIMKMSVGICIADRIISEVGENANKEKNMEMIALCMLATECLGMVKDKYLNPIIDQVKKKAEG